MPKRTYELTEKQKRAATKWYKKGYTTHGKLSKKLGVSRQKVSNWLKSKKLGKRAPSEFWRDVEVYKDTFGVTHKEATKDVKFGKKWFERRQARLKGEAKARDEMREKWHRIMKGDIEKDFWKATEGEELMEFAGYD